MFDSDKELSVMMQLYVAQRGGYSHAIYLYRKRGALARASLSIHHIMLTIKCYLSFKS